LLFIRATGALNARGLFAAALAGAVFGLHPLHVESVAWVSERKDVLYAFFWLLSLLAYVGYASPGATRHRALYYSLCIVFFLLSLFSKPMAVTLPVVLLILDFYPLKRLCLTRSFLKVAILEKAPFFALSTAFSIMTFVAQSSAMNAMNYFSLWERLLGAEKSLGFYISKTFLPFNLVPYYPLLKKSHITMGHIVSFLFIVIVTFIAIRLWKRVPLLIAAWAYYVITLLPVLGIIQVGGQSAADRYMYLPILGPLMVLAALGARAWGNSLKYHRLLIALTVSVTIFLSVLTLRQIPVWKDSLSLWEYVAEKEPEAVKAHYNLGNAYMDRGNYAKAKEAWERAVDVEPGHSPALNHLGNIYFMYNSFTEAEKYYYAAVKSDEKNAEARYNLARTLEKLNKRNEAVKHYKILLDTASPNYASLFPKVRERLLLLGNK
jgi:hypothetical protein